MLVETTGWQARQRDNICPFDLTPAVRQSEAGGAAEGQGGWGCQALGATLHWRLWWKHQARHNQQKGTVLHAIVSAAYNSSTVLSATVYTMAGVMPYHGRGSCSCTRSVRQDYLSRGIRYGLSLLVVRPWGAPAAVTSPGSDVTPLATG